MRDLSFQVLLALLSLACSVPVWRRRSPWLWLLGGLGLLGAGFVFALSQAGLVGFTFIRLFSHVVFLALPFYLLLCAFSLPPLWQRLNWICFAAILLVGADAFWVEPRWLTVNYHTIKNPLIKKPVRVVVLSDIQTDHVGDYERKAILHARSLQADLVLFPGDYVQLPYGERGAQERAAFSAALRNAKLAPRLGAYAVRGDCESDAWTELFQDTGVRALPKTQLLDLEELELAGLSLHDSRVGSSLPPAKKFRIVFGHAPDFALSAPRAQLLLAGHTHGGQIQIPFFGPLVTLTQVPRAWAGGGLVKLGEDQHLIVSRGIGHERGPAPRLRFNCRPEIVVVDLLPKEKP